MWTIDSIDTEQHYGHHHNNHPSSSPPQLSSSSFLVTASTTVSSFIKSLCADDNVDDADGDGEQRVYQAFNEGGRCARVALSDYCARHFLQCSSMSSWSYSCSNDNLKCRLETIDELLHNKTRRNRHNHDHSQGQGQGKGQGPDTSQHDQQNQQFLKRRMYPPFVVERTDFWCDNSTGDNSNDDDDDHHVGSSSSGSSSRHARLHIMLRMVVFGSGIGDEMSVRRTCSDLLTTWFTPAATSSSGTSTPSLSYSNLMRHVATVVLQQRLRQRLSQLEAVAFVADGSILPRKSGTSQAAMASPPAVPFRTPSIVDPARSNLSSSIQIDMGRLVDFLPPSLPVIERKGSLITLSGLLIGGGVHLICGGGYHGKSTLLQTIAAGVYDKIPGDGREYCATVTTATSVRAEDGRYVNNCNISAFISNLPTPPGVAKTIDTQHFSTRDASGSTSQAANVIEAMELGATALLVDEDISAANFMARDGRMRALVMDESITPLLYRVNGLYNRYKISSIVVVGGVGDWLDVPHSVVLLDKYVASDATPKARSISRQFSYGHVEYGGRGVVHRLEWERSGTPAPRRPLDSFCSRYDSNVVISLLDGGHSIAIDRHDAMDIDNDDDDGNNVIVSHDDEDDGVFEASRMEQLLGRRQLYGCGICVVWLLQKAPLHPGLGMKGLLKLLDEELDKKGMTGILSDLHESVNGTRLPHSFLRLLETVGFAERPRMVEIGQALTRLQGVQFEEVPVEEDEDDAIELAKQLEEERKKQALAELWARRRAKTAINAESS